MQIHHTTSEIRLRSLVRIRRIEESIANRYKEQKMRCPVHLSVGQEAIAVGVCEHLSVNDYAMSGHRAHAHYLAKGGDLKRMLAEIYGKVTGCCLGRGGSMHLVDLSCGFLGSTPIVGGSLPVGVGLAFGSVLYPNHLKNCIDRVAKEKRVVAIFFGEGATEEGVFAECLNFAMLKKLPILFVCENNLYSVYSPLEVRQPATRDRPSFAKAHGMFALEGNGNDVEEVSKLTKEATDYIREGNGPVFVEFSTYRFREHCGPDLDPYQPQEEVECWKAQDPLCHVQIPRELEEEIAQEIEEAFIFAEKSPYPNLEQEMRLYA